MNNLSERVQGEFKSWKEKYEIPSHMEFEVKTLLKLQEEYDLVEVGSNTTKTRESLLGMINRLHMGMRLKEKAVATQKKKMYIDCIWTESRENNKVLVYVDNELIVLACGSFLPPKSMGSFAKDIYNIAVAKKCEIYIDTQGFGMSLYDHLMEFRDLKVYELKISRKG